MRRVYPRVDYSQARGQLLCLGSRAKASTLDFMIGIGVSSAIPHSVRLFVRSSPCWRYSKSGIIICNNFLDYVEDIYDGGPLCPGYNP